jgi:hypothetical protein
LLLEEKVLTISELVLVQELDLIVSIELEEHVRQGFQKSLLRAKPISFSLKMDKGKYIEIQASTWRNVSDGLFNYESDRHQ